MTRASSRAPNGSSGPVITRIWCPRGCRHSDPDSPWSAEYRWCAAFRHPR